MRRLLWIGLGLAAMGLFARDEDGDGDIDQPGLLATPFLLGLAIEVAIFALRNSQGKVMFPPKQG